MSEPVLIAGVDYPPESFHMKLYRDDMGYFVHYLSGTGKAETKRITAKQAIKFMQMCDEVYTTTSALSDGMHRLKDLFK